MNHTKQPKHERTIFWSLVLLCIAIRLIGIWNEYPTGDDYAHLGRAMQMVGGKTLDPGWYGYTSGQYYLYCILLALIYVGGMVLGFFSSANDFYYFYLSDPELVVQYLKLANGLISSLAVVFIYKACRLLFSRTAAIVVAICYAFMSAAVYWSVQLWPESSLLFFSSLCVYLAVKYYASGRLKHFLLFALFSGVSVGFKQNAVFLVLFVPVFYLLVRFKQQQPVLVALKHLIYAGVLAFIGMLVTSPYTFIMLNEASDISGEFHTLGSIGDDNTFHAQRPVAYFIYTLNFFAPYFFYFLLAGLAYVAFACRNRIIGIFLLPFILLSLIIYFYPSSHPYHWVPMIPFFCLFLGMIFHAGGRFSVVARLFVFLFLGFHVYDYIIKFDERFKQNSIYGAKKWIEANVPNGSNILMDGGYIPRVLRTNEQVAEELEAVKKVNKNDGKRLALELKMKKKHAYNLSYLKINTDSRHSGYDSVSRTIIQTDSVYSIDDYKRMGIDYVVLSAGFHSRFWAEPQYENIVAKYRNFFESDYPQYEFSEATGFKDDPVTIIDLTGKGRD